MEVKGRDMVAGVPKTVVVNSDEIREALAEPINAIVEAVLLALERTPPELAADIVDKGIVLTGGGALLKNIDVLLREETGLPVMVSDDPISAVVLGSGKTLDHIELLEGSHDRLRCPSLERASPFGRWHSVDPRVDRPPWARSSATAIPRSSCCFWRFRSSSCAPASASRRT